MASRIAIPRVQLGQTAGVGPVSLPWRGRVLPLYEVCALVGCLGLEPRIGWF